MAGLCLKVSHLMPSGFGVALRCVDVLSGLTLLDRERLPGPGGFRMV